MTHRSIRGTAIAIALGSALLLGNLPGQPALAQASASVVEADVFARVDGHVISVRDYQSALAAGIRQKFYHGRPPEEELEKFRREVGERLVMQILLGEEAVRRGIEPDRSAIEKQVAEYDRRYAGNEQWKRSREDVVPRLTAELERRSRLERLEASVRAVAPVDEEQARAYYHAKPAHFTEPERVRLSLILLKVEPAAPAATWEAAFAEAAQLAARIAEGADFAQLARLHSADPSAAQGGDLGYLHRGMLSEEIERQFVDALGPGEMSKPTRVLEGVALVRLEDRKPPRVRSYDEVAKSARDLVQRERGEKAWAKLNADLRTAAVVHLDETRYGQAAPAGRHGAN